MHQAFSTSTAFVHSLCNPQAVFKRDLFAELVQLQTCTGVSSTKGANNVAQHLPAVRRSCTSKNCCAGRSCAVPLQRKHYMQTLNFC